MQGLEIPKISIVVPVYNVEDYLRRCLDSLVQQTLSNIEIIVVDDCSPDNSCQIIGEYVKKYTFVKCIKHQKNKGLSGARNTGIKAAKGEYIGFVDSDDWIALDTYEIAYQRIKETNALILIFDRVMEYDNGAEVNPIVQENKIFDSGWAYQQDAIRKQNVKAGAWDKLFDRAFVLKHDLWFPEGKIHEDLLFTFRAIFLAEKVVTIPNHFYHYKKDRTDSITNLKRAKDKDVLETVKSLSDFIRKSPKPEVLDSYAYRELIYDWVCYSVLYRYPKTKPQTKEHDQIMLDIIHDKDFKETLQFMTKKKGVKLKHKIPAWLSLNNLFLFKKFVYWTFFFKSKKQKLSKIKFLEIAFL